MRLFMRYQVYPIEDSYYAYNIGLNEFYRSLFLSSSSTLKQLRNITVHVNIFINFIAFYMMTQTVKIKYHLTVTFFISNGDLTNGNENMNSYSYRLENIKLW